jgi:peptide/nickel transport system ATP-binding protein
MMTEKADSLIDVKNLKVYFTMREGTVKAVDDVSFGIPRSKTLGVVGESGCGKSVTSRAVLRIVPHPGKIIAGQILFNRNGGSQPIDLVQMDARGREIRKIRGGEIAMVFQEPMTSLSPVHTVANQIIEAILLHQDVSKREARVQAIEMLRLVNMPKPEQTIDSYPHQLSGGMRQRAMIAMALSCKPGLLIADEPTTALDVTTEAQILDLMRELQDRLGMAIMYITHNLGVVAEMAEEVIVMYLGKIVEQADVDTIYHNPQHPYTRNLLLSIPRLGQKTGRRLQAIKGMVPDPFNLPQGCPFHPRCPDFMPGVCDTASPPEVEISPGHTVLCHLHA